MIKAKCACGASVEIDHASVTNEMASLREWLVDHRAHGNPDTITGLSAVEVSQLPPLATLRVQGVVK